MPLGYIGDAGKMADRPQKLCNTAKGRIGKNYGSHVIKNTNSDTQS